MTIETSAYHSFLRETFLGIAHEAVNQHIINLATNVNGVFDGRYIGTGTVPPVVLSTPVPVTLGGTNITSYAVGDLLYASAPTVLSKLTDVATGNALLSGGVATAPAWGKVGLTTHVSGLLPITNGGTNSSTALTNNQVMVSAAGKITELGAMTNGQLVIGSTGAAPVIAALTAGTGISITPSAGAITIATTGAPPTGAAGGDLSGTYPNPTVAKLQGRAFATTAPSDGQVIVWDNAGATWQPSFTTLITGLGTIGTGTWQGTSIATSYTDAKLKTLTGTTNRITIGGTATDPTVDISTAYIGQATITTLGTITTGVWTGTTIAIVNGGTGQATTIAAFDALSPLTTLGDILYHNGTHNVRLPGNIVTTKKYLSQTGPGAGSAAPIWAIIASADITNSDFVTSVTGTTNRITSSGGLTPAIDISASYVGQSSITTLGTITTGTWTGTTIAIANGGTGATAALGAFNALSPVTTRGDLITRDATNNVRLAVGANHTVLKSDGTDPSWGAVVLTTDISGILPSANGGTGVNNAGTLTNASNTTITGGGTLALGGFTLTVPATGTAALGTGAANRMAYWSGTNALTSSSNFNFDGTTIGIGTALDATKMIAVSKSYSTDADNFGIYADITQSAASTHTLYGYRVIANATHTTGTLNNLQGQSVVAKLLGNGGTTTTVDVLTANASVSTGAIATDLNLIRAFTIANSGTVGTLRGILVENMTGATTNYAIETNGGQFVHNQQGDAVSTFRIEGDTDQNLIYTDCANDRVGIGTASPAVKLDVVGQLKVSNAALLIGGFTLTVPATGTIVLLTGAQTITGIKTLDQAGITTTYTDALIVTNSTAATSGVAVQQSGSLRFTTHVWNTTATAADNTFDVRNTLVPTSGTTPTAQLSWRWSNNGAAYATKMQLSDTGQLDVATGYRIGAAAASGTILRGDGTNYVASTLTIPNTATTGDVLIATATSVIGVVAAVAAGSYMRSAGTGTAPVWSTITLPNAAVVGDLWYASATSVISALAKDTNASRYLSNSGASNIPAWSQVDLTNGVTGILPAANGGTGINNSTRTLTINTNAGTLAFSAGSLTLTIAATGTAALGTGTTNQLAFWSGTNTITSSANLTFDGTILRSAAGGSSSLATHGGSIFDHYVDAGNTTTGETDLYSDTTPASALAANGDKFVATYAGNMVGSATATTTLKVYFGGTLICNSGAQTSSAATNWQVDVLIVRVSATVVRCTITMVIASLTVANSPKYTEVTGLTLSNTNILKITGQRAGTGAATNDILAKLGTVGWYSAA